MGDVGLEFGYMHSSRWMVVVTIQTVRSVLLAANMAGLQFACHGIGPLGLDENRRAREAGETGEADEAGEAAGRYF